LVIGGFGQRAERRGWVGQRLAVGSENPSSERGKSDEFDVGGADAFEGERKRVNSNESFDAVRPTDRTSFLTITGLRHSSRTHRTAA
jgi:hypothetical protein